MEIYAVVNGIKMSHAEYKAYRKAKAGHGKGGEETNRNER